jgi:type II secretory pathway pseudopilin PulG
MELDGNYGLSQAEVEQINKAVEEEEQQKALAAQQQAQAQAAEAESEVPQPQPEQQTTEQPEPKAEGNGYNTGNPQLDADLERMGAPKPGTSDNPVIQGLEEVSNSVNTGVNKGLRSITTAKERWEDMAKGEDVGGPDYEPGLGAPIRSRSASS